MCQNLQRLCIFKYGLDEGPLGGLPFHPVNPFLIQFEIYDRNVFYFRKEAYLLLWYLVDVYAAFGQIHPPEDFFLKFLLLFGNIPFWQQKIRSIPNSRGGNLQFAFWTNPYPEPQRIQINSGNYLVMTQTLCSLNGLIPAEVPSSLLHYETANWKFNDTYLEEWHQKYSLSFGSVSLN
ncbi:hypothetical protein RHMOL_Rhmol10G0175800 [Rhododendron molle]|uniref:Uncharacterized protein n=1 Tax=Rhododendron molle TaxID=49168 RepID=A0ACC0M3N0_RHOML|nr:hypothetical protein RHMOL_Rhmol10G0175800 [Rhododendron molle]